MTESPELRRVRLKASINEASALLPVDDRALLNADGLEEGYWLAHDEGTLGGGAKRAMISLVGRSDDTWSIRPVDLSTPSGGHPTRSRRVSGSQTTKKAPRRQKGWPVTDAEALATHDGWVFVVGSGFLGANNKLDRRRAFVARFSPAHLNVGPKAVAGDVEILDLDTALLAAVNDALAHSAIELIETVAPIAKATAKAADINAGDIGAGATPLNIEGAACVGSSFVLGLRWPVTASGQPILIEIEGGADLLAGDWSDATASELAALPMRVRTIDVVDASKKKALGVRGLTATGQALHAIVGPTDRDLAASKIKAGAFTHVTIDVATGATNPQQTFEGYRKVEALAARPGGGWVYGLDDEKAIVLLTSDA